MIAKNLTLTNFSRSLSSPALCIRPGNEKELINYLNNYSGFILAGGSGLNYNDCAFNKENLVVDMRKLNHILDFNIETGIVICQAGTLIKDLFLIHPDFIPPVIPGTVGATVAGCIAHDVHGKNNPKAGSFGHHVLWIDLWVNNNTLHCSPEENSDLFSATLGGLGLTGIILRSALRLTKAHRSVQVIHKKVRSYQQLIADMSSVGIHQDYQVAWLDLLHPKQKCILSQANHNSGPTSKIQTSPSIPKFPVSLISRWGIQLFNNFYFHYKSATETLSLLEFNNPLDTIQHWNRLYGPKGLIQFQALFSQESAVETLEHLVDLIKQYHAFPTLSVLKFFTRPGKGLLSFCQPGFTIAIDFNNNSNSIAAIKAMNQYITMHGGRVYLSKDFLINKEQFKKMYPSNTIFSEKLTKYHCGMHSDLATRILDF